MANEIKLEYESPNLLVFEVKSEDIITKSVDFDGGQSGLSFQKSNK